MGDRTGISWTNATWNPCTGCEKVSPGCAHCYAETVALRFWTKQYQPVRYIDEAGSADWRPRRFTDVQCHEDRLEQPLRWKRPRRIFVNSMSDLFHEDVPDAFIDRVFAVMASSPRHTFQVLTKRAERQRDYLSEASTRWSRMVHSDESIDVLPLYRWPLSNVWIGVSVENQHFADERLPLLLMTPAVIRWVSYEPALGPVDFSSYFLHEPFDGYAHGGLDWGVVGGESGDGARPFGLSWARLFVEQFRRAGRPVFVKQMGEQPFGMGLPVGGFRRKKGDDPDEWPDDLRVQEYPG